MTLETQVLGASVWWWMRSILCLHFQDPIALSSSRKSTPRVGWLIEHVSGITDVLQPPSAHLSLDSSPKADVHIMFERELHVHLPGDPPHQKEV